MEPAFYVMKTKVNPCKFTACSWLPQQEFWPMRVFEKIKNSHFLMYFFYLSLNLLTHIIRTFLFDPQDMGNSR